MSSSAAPRRSRPRLLRAGGRVAHAGAVPGRPTNDRPRPAAGAEPAHCTDLGEGQEGPRRRARLAAVVRGHLTRSTIDIRTVSAMPFGAQVTITALVPAVLVATAVRSGPRTQGSSREETTEIGRA